MKKEAMKKTAKSEMDDDLRPAYDLHLLLKDGVKGKYAERYRAGTNLVLLDPDLAKVFANDEEKSTQPYERHFGRAGSLNIDTGSRVAHEPECYGGPQ